MKKLTVLFFMLSVLFLLIGCNKEETIASKPYGYGLIELDYVARGSFSYLSDTPFQVNDFTLEVFYMPSIWAEIDNSYYDQIPNNHLEFLYLNLAEDTLKIYPKRLLIGSIILEGMILNQSVVYQLEDATPFTDYLSTRDLIKWYIEAIETSNTSYIFQDDLIPTNLKSRYQLEPAHTPFQMVMIHHHTIQWVEEPNSFDDFSMLFPEYHAPSVHLIFLDAYAHINDPEYIISRQYK